MSWEVTQVLEGKNRGKDISSHMTKVENDFINDGANLKRLELEIYLKLDLLKLWINKSKAFSRKRDFASGSEFKYK